MDIIKQARYSLCLFMLFLTALLTSCTHVKRPDGPPSFYVDETKIPNATPKREPLSKYGNMSFYNVFGKRYNTLKSSKNYQAVGIASWYGTKFHSRKTSSGEPYDMLAMTAAHKTLPLPTYVEVTNLNNQKKIIVKVNDRGPFENNRLIDLSYVAAKKLGMIGRGTALVRVKSIDLNVPKPSLFVTKTFVEKTTYTRQYKKTIYQLPNKHFIKNYEPQSQLVYLQVGSFRSALHAKKLQNQLASKLSTKVKIFKPSKSIKLYQVHVGPFKDVAAAHKVKNQLNALGIRFNIVRNH